MQLRRPPDEVLLVQSVVLGELEKMVEDFTCLQKIKRRTSKQYVLVKTEFTEKQTNENGNLISIGMFMLFE